MAGSIIAASLITGLNSDLPGTVIAPRKTKYLTEHVYDTVTGRVLPIPQGFRLIGRPFHPPPRGAAGGGRRVRETRPIRKPPSQETAP